MKTEADVAALNIGLKEGDDAELAHASEVIAHAKRMAEIAEKSDLKREALYKALRPSTHPRFDNDHKLMQAMSVKLQARFKF